MKVPREFSLTLGDAAGDEKATGPVFLVFAAAVNWTSPLILPTFNKHLPTICRARRGRLFVRLVLAVGGQRCCFAYTGRRCVRLRTPPSKEASDGLRQPTCEQRAVMETHRVASGRSFCLFFVAGRPDLAVDFSRVESVEPYLFHVSRDVLSSPLLYERANEAVNEEYPQIRLRCPCRVDVHRQLKV